MLYVVTSAFTLAKCIRDRVEETELVSRVDQARWTSCLPSRICCALRIPDSSIELAGSLGRVRSADAAIQVRRPGHWQSRMMADSSVRRLRMIQAAERARQAIAYRAIGWEVISRVTPASSASEATSEMTNSTMVPKKPARSAAVRP